MQIQINFLTVAAVALIMASCTNDEKKPGARTDSQPLIDPSIAVPAFNADSAYQYIAEQVAFGPRVPGTEAHTLCGDYLEKKLRDFGAEVVSQRGTVTAYDGSQLPMRNIIGQFNPSSPNRLLLFAHWDTRPFADKDSTDVNMPIDGANDGGSGVGVLLEVARLLGKTTPKYGIDIIFFDVEDYGAPEGGISEGKYTDWCLGSQYWGKNPHKSGYTAKYGILLDMVGAADAVFPKEGTSVYFDARLVRKVWNVAKELGYGHLFIDEVSSETIDDHLFVNQLANIPSINIVHFHTGDLPHSYGHFHHTHKDSMDIIDRKTLQAVGHVVSTLIYNEK
jgi:hypothetical protein